MRHAENVPLVEFTYLAFTHMGVTIGDSGFCCCVCAMSFECKLTPCLLILHRHSGPQSILDYKQENIFLSSPFPTVKKLLLCEIQVPASVTWPPV